MVDNVQYIRFGREVFSSLPEQDSNASFTDTIKKHSDYETDSTRSTRIRVIKRNERPKPDFIIKKLAKRHSIRIEEPIDEQRDDNFATNLVGRRLPSRTKVPFLSRAIPLSTDHSFERCTCGAVFVTRVGKRQHQARFCKFVKNNQNNRIRVENKIEDNEVSAVNEPSCEGVHAEDEGVEINYGNNVTINYVNSEPAAVIQYQNNEGCVIFLQEDSLNKHKEMTLLCGNVGPMQELTYSKFDNFITGSTVDNVS